MSQFLALIKSLIPILEPIGEQGIAQLFDMLDAYIADHVGGDMKDMAPIISKAMREIALIEFKKLK